MVAREVPRRRMLAAGAGGVLAAALPARPAAAQQAGPNILWLVSEDNNPFIGAYGDPLARTPALDRLAREGVRYDNSFSSAPVCAPSRFAILTGVPPESCGPAEHMRAEGKIPSFLRGFPEYLREAGYFCTNNSKTDYNAPFDPAQVWDQSGIFAHWRWRPKGRPFFSVFNYMTTHENALFYAGPGKTRPEDVRVPAYLPDTPHIRTDRARYYDLMARMDTEVAARLAELERDGLAEDTIVFYYSDNGGVLPRSKRYCYDSGLRTALIVRFPRRWAHLAPAAPGSVIDSPVTSLDLAPTVLSLAGLKVPDHMSGAPLTGRRRPAPAFGVRNRMDERYDMVRTVRDERYRYIRNYSPHRPYGQHLAYAWQQKGYQDWEKAHVDGTLTEIQDRFWRTKPAEELYDLRSDPDEVHDLTGDPGHRAVLERLRTALDDHILQVNDNGFIPEGSPLEGYDQSRAPGAYPLRRVLRLAAVAIQRDPARIALLTRDLDDGNEVIRYWAASGLLMLESGAGPAVGRLADRLEAEPSVRVRIVLAEALARLGRTDPAVPFLADTLRDHRDPRVRLQAVNALTYIGKAAAPALPAISRSTLSSDEYVRNAARYLWLVLTGIYRPGTPVYLPF
ncbi:sulfatase-like hydrolase/transferase [Actinomadura sp. 7K507]|uniref:sulfatase-like hydrolase/transferase n=1 Tax=Actinomadura sp. 7K507 TaxID=2530365 RepID=UPI001044E607|nr:sulfatase-like hydrolase/transferase [Actinomadura sp. 7K507]TDC92509.1 sulfatase [Actinomadura sp. 7K507]